MSERPDDNASCFVACGSGRAKSPGQQKGRSLLSAILLLTAMSGFEGTSAGQDTPVQTANGAQPQDQANSATSDETEVPQGATDLLEGDFLKQWKIYNSGPAVDAGGVWKIIRETPDGEPVLVCLGEPKGFAFTISQYSDFELTLEWKYPKDANGNSGVLLYTQNEPRIWPTCVQVQLHQPKAGSIFPSGDATTDNTRDADPDLARPVNTWNECKIVSRGGRLSVDINGKKAGEISGAKPAAGSIALQSEGSEVHFRRIRLRKIAKDETEPPVQNEKSDKAQETDKPPASVNTTAS
jgi:hypothetical protein